MKLDIGGVKGQKVGPGMCGPWTRHAPVWGRPARLDRTDSLNKEMWTPRLGIRRAAWLGWLTRD